eukprot:s5488_g1.t1
MQAAMPIDRTTAPAESDVSVLMDITNLQSPIRHANQKPIPVGAPPSSLAVLNSPVWYCENAPFSGKILDMYSFMQVSSIKTSPHSDNQDALLDAFHHGHAQPVQPGEHDSGLSDEAASDATSGYEPSIAPHDPPTNDPASDDNLQEVFLYHLHDLPIRTFVHWQDYCAMIHDIARHFSLHVDSVVDAYELNVVLPDSIALVHLMNDVPVGRPACLILLDLELHGHKVEPHFQTGPFVQRSVLVVPSRVTRNGLLTLANDDVFLQGLASLWQIHSFAWELEDPSAAFMTWYLAPGLGRSSCRFGRRIMLQSDFRNWRQHLRAKWLDVLHPVEELQFQLVVPAPSTLEAGIAGHIFLIQQPIPDVVLALITTVDRAIQAGHPFKQAHALPAAIQPSDVWTMIGYEADCNTIARCAVRLQGQLLPEGDPVFVPNCFALDFLVQRGILPPTWLVIRRGIPVDVPALLAMPDHMLRQELQNAIGGTIFRRPRGPSFLSRVSAMPNATLTPPEDVVPHDPRPEWLRTLSELFHMQSFVELQEEGPVCYVLTWYLNGERASRCPDARVVRLTRLSFQWREALVRSWIDVLLRDEPDPQEVMREHTAYILPSRVTIPDLHALIVPAFVRHRPARSRRGPQILPVDSAVEVHSGDSIVFEVQGPSTASRPGPSSVGQGTQGGSLLQTAVKIRTQTVAPARRMSADVMPSQLWLLPHALDAPRLPPRTFVPGDEDSLIADASAVWNDSIPNPASIHVWRICSDFLLVEGVHTGHVPILLTTEVTDCSAKHVVTTAHWCPCRLESGELLTLFSLSAECSVEAITCLINDIEVLLLTDYGWAFAGALSTALVTSASSCAAELAAAVLAYKFAYDLLKLLMCVRPAEISVTFCFGSLTVGRQSEGTWQARVAKPMSTFVRSMHRWIASAFPVDIAHVHVRAHQGEPGNELVDTLAYQATQGEPLQDLSDWISYVTQPGFVRAADWFWFVARQDLQWEGTSLQFPKAAGTVPPTSVMPTFTAPLTSAVSDPIGHLDLQMATCNVLSLCPSRRISDFRVTVSVFLSF